MLDVTKYPPSAHGFTCRNCGGGDRGRVAIYRPFGEVSLSLNRTVTCMVLKANDRRTSCPCHDEFRGPRSNYVRQVALATTTTTPSDGFTFLLTCIDRFTRWPEVIPVSDISTEALAKSFIANWISLFGVPAIITTDQGGQLQSRLYSLKQMLGIQRIRTTPYHPSSNGMVVCLHRTIKQAIRCHDTKWTESLPVVLLGL
ncbi:retrovirus-related Pol polyprotein from transposon 412 [Trichonephila clavipes]|nr:retrovirus-related Pol polyprotein from transposon 412 [Trichonephila clavipes]